MSSGKLLLSKVEFEQNIPMRKRRSLQNFIFAEHFKPGKLNVNDIYNPKEVLPGNGNTFDESPAKRKFKSWDDVYHVTSTSNHKTYHVPPGSVYKFCYFSHSFEYISPL